MGESGPPPPQKWPILAQKKCLKMRILGQKQCFLGSGGQFKAPAPYFAGSRLKEKYMLQGSGAGKWVIQPPPPPPKWPFFAQKKA